MARTVQKVRIALVLLAGVGLSPVQGGTDVWNSAHRLLYFSSDDTLSGGQYTLKDGQKIRLLFLPFSYAVSPDDTTSLYLTGSPGFGATTYGGGTAMDVYGAKLGGGLQYAAGVDSTVRIGGTYQYMTWDAASPAGYGYDASLQYDYRPWYGGWNPYLTTQLRYYGTSLTRGTKKETTSSWSAKAQVGLVTPVFAHLFDLPIRLEVYGGGSAYQGDLIRILQTKYLTYAGVKAYMRSPILPDYLGDMTLTSQVVRGEDFKGLSIGLGVTF